MAQQNQDREQDLDQDREHDRVQDREQEARMQRLKELINFQYENIASFKDPTRIHQFGFNGLGTLSDTLSFLIGDILVEHPEILDYATLYGWIDSLKDGVV